MTESRVFADEQQLSITDYDDQEGLKDGLPRHDSYPPQQGKSGRAGSFELPRIPTVIRDDDRQRRASSSNLLVRSEVMSQTGRDLLHAQHTDVFRAEDRASLASTGVTNSNGLDTSITTAAMHASAGHRLSTPAQPPRARLDREKVVGAEKLADNYKNINSNLDGQHSAAFVRRRSSLQEAPSSMPFTSPSITSGEQAAGDVARRLDDETFTRSEENRAVLRNTANDSLLNATPVVACSTKYDNRRSFGHKYTESNVSSAMSDITQYASASQLHAPVISSSAIAVNGEVAQKPVESSTAAAKQQQQPVKVYRAASHSQINTGIYPAPNNNNARLVREPQHDEKVDGGNEPSASGSHNIHVGKKKKGSNWLQALNPNYKYRADEFKRYFMTPPSCQQYAGERLVIDYSCALHREILCQGRMYCSQYRLCFRFNIFGVERSYDWPWTQIGSIYKDKTALIIPNAISVKLAGKDGEHLFFTTFNARDKAFAMLLRLWQSANFTLLNSQRTANGNRLSVSGHEHVASDVAPLTSPEIWSLIHFSYGDELGLTTEDEDDYISPAYLKYSYDDGAAALVSGSSGGSGSSKTKAAFLDVSGRSRRSQQQPGKLTAAGRSYQTSNVTTTKEHVSASKGRIVGSEIAAVGESVSKSSSSAVLRDHSTSSADVEVATSRRDGEDAARKYSRKHHRTARIENGDEQVFDEAESPAITDPSTDNNDEDEEIDPSMIIPNNLPEPSGNVLMDELFDLSVDQVFVMLFSDSKFSRVFFERRGFVDIQYSNWGDVPPSAAEFVSMNRVGNNGVHERSITYRLKAMPGQWSTSVERQRLLPESINGYLYLVQTEVRSSGVMYSDSFAVCCHYALTRTGDNSCRLCVHGESIFLKRVLMMRSVIESKVASTFREHFGLLRSTLQEATRDEIPKLMGAGQAAASGNESDVGLKQKMPELHKLADPPLSRRTSVAVSVGRRRLNADFSASSNSSFASTHKTRRVGAEGRQNEVKLIDEDTDSSDDDEKRSTLRAHAVPPGAVASTSRVSSNLMVKSDGTPLRRKASKQRHQNQSPNLPSQQPATAAAEASGSKTQVKKSLISVSPSQVEVAGAMRQHRCSACGHLDPVAVDYNNMRTANSSGWIRGVFGMFSSTSNFAVTSLLFILVVTHGILLWRLLHPVSLFSAGSGASPSPCFPVASFNANEELSASLSGMNATLNDVRKQLGVLMKKFAVEDA